MSDAELDAITAAAAESLAESGADERSIVHETLAAIRTHRLDRT